MTALLIEQLLEPKCTRIKPLMRVSIETTLQSSMLVVGLCREWSTNEDFLLLNAPYTLGLLLPST